MNKVMMSVAVMVAIGAVGCMTTDEDTDPDEVTIGEAEFTPPDRYYVRQNTASAIRGVDVVGPFQCSLKNTTLVGADSQLSFGHPVKVLRTCADRTYVFVQSLWNTSLYYMMRWDALNPL